MKCHVSWRAGGCGIRGVTLDLDVVFGGDLGLGCGIRGVTLDLDVVLGGDLGLGCGVRG